MSTINLQFVLNAVREIETERLARAVCSLADGRLIPVLTGQSTTEVKGLVRNGDGTQYAVTLTAERAFCSCPDALFRHSICKHCIALALTVLRTPEAAVKEEPRPDLRLGKVRPGFQFAA